MTLALGIGGACAVFSVVDDMYLRSLPFAHEDRLLRLRDSTRTPGGAIVTVNTNAPHFLEIASQSRTLAGVSAGEASRSTAARCVSWACCRPDIDSLTTPTSGSRCASPMRRRTTSRFSRGWRQE